ncbi:thrombospondin type-1 domain-containing protein 7A-like [Amphiura filiformis]|uniref:thrombospondin type-1 domain-containing protein 7A-like n=1 Tax=Amphiura filiformis TaxID=82378 RepID=UPI003B225AA2
MKFLSALQLVCALMVVSSGCAWGNIRQTRELKSPAPTELSGNENEIFPEEEPMIPSPFSWRTGEWSSCEEQGEANKCGKKRNVRCIFTENNREIPFHYCDSEQRTNTFEPCNVCKEDCVLTTWSDWSECSASCAPATRYRTRGVVRRADHGGKDCGKLSEIESCSDLQECRIEVVVPTYTWKIGEWTSCRQMSARNDTCELGQRFRTITCIDNGGEEVKESLCSQSQEVFLYSPLDRKPSEEEACTLPCDCQVSAWDPWTTCSKSCLDPAVPDEVGYQTRTRDVVRLSENGGLPCPSLSEQKPCSEDDLPTCPRYQWYTQEWQDCKLLVENIPAGCGAGRQKRQVYCVEEGDTELRPVKDALCVASVISDPANQPPPMKRACFVPCPVDCQVGQWQNWSPCTQSCGTGGQHIRLRSVLVPPSHGGAECGSRIQTKECEPIECAWWYSTRWSVCFLDHDHTGCGPGTRHRAVYCMSARDELLLDDVCNATSKPPNMGDCRVPCPSECVVSDWSAWGTCSKTCGKKGGVQIRTRKILAYADPSVSTCLPEDELIQSRPCNLHISCQSYMWQVGAWGSCTSNRTAVCGEGMGTQTRELTCEKDTGVIAENELCDSTSIPSTNQSCDIPCPVDCKLSPLGDWSECSATCGDNAYKTRTQRVLQLSAHGGVVCPDTATEDGIITQTAPCSNLQPCYTYQWNAGNWSQCEVLGDVCGKGLQSRDVHCGRNDYAIVLPGYCLRQLLSNPPATHQQCFLPCPGDCQLSAWSQLGPCGNDCGITSHHGYCRMRTRHLISVDPNTENPSQICPQISSEDLKDYTPCDDASHTYQWQVGEWNSCILENGYDCGHGNQSRSVLCLRSDGQQVPIQFCSTLGNSEVSQQPCEILCPEECFVSEWGDWSPCTESCGQGLQVRTRNMMQSPSPGSPACPQLFQSTVCSERSCDLLDWHITQWSPCLPIVDGITCGEGRQTRNVTCPAGTEFEKKCNSRQPKPTTEQQCHLPCTGDCVLSQWSEFTECSAPCDPSGTKTRTRIEIREATGSGMPCEKLRDEEACGFDVCPDQGYRIDTREWSTCQTSNGECGTGTKHRTINCYNQAGNVVDLNNCNSDQFNITTIEPCEVPCPIDCQLSPYSDWSTCSATCGSDGVKVRSRVIVRQPEGGGRECTGSLNQTMPCNMQPCFAYNWYRGEWSECQFETGRGCGYGERHRLVECQRSDGLTVDNEFCIMQGNPGSKNLNEILIPINDTELDIVSRKRCEVPCPGDCQVSSWNTPSPCYKSCYNSSSNPTAYTLSSRSVTKLASQDGKRCPDILVELSICPVSEAVCPSFGWQTGPWDIIAGTRNVWCQLQGTNINVTGGCVENVKPPSSKVCNPQCTAANSICDWGVCKCAMSYEGDGTRCFPASGCTANDHCPFENNVCKKRNCVCKDGYHLTDENNSPGDCEHDNVIPDPPLPGPATRGPAKTPRMNREDDSTAQFKAKHDIWIWVVVACCAIVVILVLLCIAFVVHRSRTSGEVRFDPLPTGPTLLNNYDTSFLSNGKEFLKGCVTTSTTKC